jgi:hypothetical protein
MDIRSIVNSLLKIFYYAYAHLIKIYVFFVPLPIKIPVPTILDFTNQYIERNKKRFLDTFETPLPIININIEPEFYDKKEHKLLCLDKTNPLEKNWKRRILFETTPRGNIIMFYDAFKMGFSYYSDSYNLPYSLLNAVAMKYVLTFCCRDFFMDDNVTPKDSPSPLIKIHAEETEKTEKVKKVLNRTTINSKNPFAKLKDYKNASSKDTKDEDDKNLPKEKVVEHVTNRFLCLGKTVNYKFIQPALKDMSTINGFKSNLLEHLSGETTLQKQVMNYKDFKNLRNRQIPLDT